MATTHFVPRQTIVTADWLNDVDAGIYEGEIYYSADAIGAISRHLSDKFREEVSVTDFGAVADWNGSTGTDNLAPFTAAFNHAVLLATTRGVGVKIRVPAGRYRFSNEWDVWRAASPRVDICIEGEDQLTTELIANFYGAGKSLIKCVASDGTSRASPLSIRKLGFDNASSAGGVNPLFINVLGHGESRIEEVRFGGSNNTHYRSVSGQNIRMRDVVSFYGGKHFNYKSTSGITFSVNSGTKTITASASIFSADDVGKKFFVFPSNTERRISYTIATYVDSTHATFTESGLTETNEAGHFEPARCSITSGTNTLTANAGCFVSTDVGRVIYIRGAATGAYGTGILRATITGYTSSSQVTLDVNASATATDEFFGVATMDLGIPAGWAGSSDVKMNQLHIEHYDGIAMVFQNTDSYQIVQSKIHGETTPTDSAKSMAAIWMDDHGGKFEIEMDSSCSMSDCRVYSCNFNDMTMFDATFTRGIINGQVFKNSLFTDAGGYLFVRGLNSYEDAAGSPYGLINDANYTADNTDPRTVLTDAVNLIGDSQKARIYVGRDSYFEPSGRFYPAKRLVDTVIPSTITWNGTPPSGTAATRYRWEQIGSVVYFSMRLDYAVAGVNNSSLTVVLPSDMPAPQLLSGTGSNELLAANLTGYISTASSGTSPSLSKAYMVGDGAGGYSLNAVLNSGTVAAMLGVFSGFYFTA